MKIKSLCFAAALVAIPSSALAENVGQCGWGSKLFEGQRGIAPQVLAVTTNGTSGNQTFGITTGTSGCTQDGVVRSSWKTAMFVDANMNKLARDISVGHGETLESLANLMGVEANDKPLFFAELKKNFSVIFPTDETSSVHAVNSLAAVLKQNEVLAKYSVATNA